MLKTNVFVIAGNRSEYNDFFRLLKEHFDTFVIYSEVEAPVRRIESMALQSGSLPVLFVEYPFLHRITSLLKMTPNCPDYILVSFYHQEHPRLENYENIFETVTVSRACFNPTFFLQKLDREISHKNKISSLQFEVKEFYEIGKSLSSEKDTLKLLEMIINSTISLTSSDAGTIYLVVDSKNGDWSYIKNNNYKGKLMKFAIAKNMSLNVNLEASVSPISSRSFYGYAAITGKALRIDDAYHISPESEYQHNRKFDSSTGYVTKSVLSVPMKDHENNITGVIQLINKKKSGHMKVDYLDPDSLSNIIPYDYNDELIMNSLAGQAAVVLENNLLYKDMQSLLQSYKQQNNQLLLLSKKILKAHEEERKRIAREIHDGPAQSAVNLSLKVEICKRFLQAGSFDKLEGEMENLRHAIGSTIKEIRTIIYDLKPSYLEDGIIRALENHIEVFAGNTGLDVSLEVMGDDSKIEFYITSTLYRIVQEALSNIHKHAQANAIRVNFFINAGNIHLKISDDGKGFDVNETMNKKSRRLEGGFGLEGMRERVELLRGNMTVASEPGSGTAIEIVIPLN